MRKSSDGKLWQVAYFRDVQMNEYFQHGGNTWRKCSSRTAVIAQPESAAGEWFYFSARDVVERHYSPAIA